MDPETFRTPWKITTEDFGNGVAYLITDQDGTVIAIVGRADHAEFICHRVNRFFEGL